MSFASESFTGSAGTELSVYSGVWSKQTGFSQDALIGVDSGTYLISTSTSLYACYQHSASPASADYSVFADLKYIGDAPPPQFGVCGRMAAGAGDFYFSLHIHGSNVTRLYKCIGGTFTQLGSDYSNTLTTGVAQTHELRMAGTTISVFVDGVSRISVTDSSLSAAGKAGHITLQMRHTSVQDTGSLDNWHADNAAGAGKLFRSNPSGNLSGLGSSGPFFQNPLQRVADVWKRRRGIFVPINYFNREALA